MDINTYLSFNLSKSRCEHIYNVKDQIIKIALIYKYNDVDACVRAALYHDIAKELSPEKQREILSKYDLETLKENSNLLHGYCSKYMAQELFFEQNDEVLNAIYYHTTGHPSFLTLAHLLFLADYIGLDRKFPAAEEVRKLVYAGKLKEAILLKIDNMEFHLQKKSKKLHANTEAYRKKIMEELV